VSTSDDQLNALGEPRPLEPRDLTRATSTFARAFAWHEPFYEWLMPDEATREERISALVEADIRDRFLPEGECWTIGGGAAITLWIPPLSGDGTEALAARRSEEDYAQYGSFADGLRAGDALIDSLKPPQPHWFLDTIAVAPEYHRRGLGARLLDHDLELRDAAGARCALDTHTPDNIAFYERRGFEVAGHGPLGPGLDVYVMVREPRG
jgi:ribosomal protein S18 acetylase RimI-like enzyme